MSLVDYPLERILKLNPCECYCEIVQHEDIFQRCEKDNIEHRQ